MFSLLAFAFLLICAAQLAYTDTGYTALMYSGICILFVALAVQV